MKKVVLRTLVVIALLAAIAPVASATAEDRDIIVPNPYAWEGN
jgi:hypothetical protein